MNIIITFQIITATFLDLSLISKTKGDIQNPL